MALGIEYNTSYVPGDSPLSYGIKCRSQNGVIYVQYKHGSKMVKAHLCVVVNGRSALKHCHVTGEFFSFLFCFRRIPFFLFLRAHAATQPAPRVIFLVHAALIWQLFSICNYRDPWLEPIFRSTLNIYQLTFIIMHQDEI